MTELYFSTGSCSTPDEKGNTSKEENNMDLDDDHFNPLIYFVCKLCRKAFPGVTELLSHKKLQHTKNELKGIQSIIFEERFVKFKIEDTSNSVLSRSTEPISWNDTAENNIQENRQDLMNHSFDPAPADSKTVVLPKKHPLVCVTRLTAKEINSFLKKRLCTKTDDTQDRNLIIHTNQNDISNSNFNDFNAVNHCQVSEPVITTEDANQSCGVFVQRNRASADLSEYTASQLAIEDTKVENVQHRAPPLKTSDVDLPENLNSPIIDDDEIIHLAGPYVRLEKLTWKQIHSKLISSTTATPDLSFVGCAGKSTSTPKPNTSLKDATSTGSCQQKLNSTGNNRFNQKQSIKIENSNTFPKNALTNSVPPRNFMISNDFSSDFKKKLKGEDFTVANIIKKSSADSTEKFQFESTRDPTNIVSTKSASISQNTLPTPSSETTAEMKCSENKICSDCHQNFFTMKELGDHKENCSPRSPSDKLGLSNKVAFLTAPAIVLGHSTTKKTAEVSPAKVRKCPDQIRDCNRTQNVILFNKDSTSAAPLTITKENPVTCKLCTTTLVTKAEFQNHCKNCYLHNKDRHIHCISCDKDFKNPQQLNFHLLDIHFTPENLPGMPGETNGLSIEPQFEDTNEPYDYAESNHIESGDPPLTKWLVKRKQDFPDFILLDPDPTHPEFQVSHIGYGVTCRLCNTKLRSEIEVKTHVSACWPYNKNNHCFCVRCKKANWKSADLLKHRRTAHSGKLLPLPHFFCIECNLEFQTQEELDLHEYSLQEFFANMRAAVDTNKSGSISRPATTPKDSNAFYPTGSVLVGDDHRNDYPAKKIIRKPKTPKRIRSNNNKNVVCTKETTVTSIPVKAVAVGSNEGGSSQQLQVQTGNLQSSRFSCSMCNEPFNSAFELQCHNVLNFRECVSKWTNLVSESPSQKSIGEEHGTMTNVENTVTFPEGQTCGSPVPVVPITGEGDNFLLITETGRVESVTVHKQSGKESDGGICEPSKISTSTQVETLSLADWFRQIPIPSMKPPANSAKNSTIITCHTNTMTTAGTTQTQIDSIQCSRENNKNSLLGTSKCSYTKPKQSFNSAVLEGVKSTHNVDVIGEKESGEVFTLDDDDDDVQIVDAVEKVAVQNPKQNDKKSAKEIFEQNKNITDKETEIPSVSLVDWLNLQKDQKCLDLHPGSDSPVNVILLDPDLTSAALVEPIKISKESPVTCKLCQAKLETEPDVKNHAENCYLHNKDRHIHCISCNKHFKYPQHLNFHLNKVHFTSENPPGKKHTGGELPVPVGPEIENRNKNDCDDGDDGLPLTEWLVKRKQNFPDLILLNPDPTHPDFKISHIGYGIKCRLCNAKLRSEIEVKSHVACCLTYNKRNHRFCVLCKTSNWNSEKLLKHRRISHSGNFERLPPFFCIECKQEFGTKKELDLHEKSLEEFFENNMRMAMSSKKVASSPTITTLNAARTSTTFHSTGNVGGRMDDNCSIFLATNIFEKPDAGTQAQLKVRNPNIGTAGYAKKSVASTSNTMKALGLRIISKAGSKEQKSIPPGVPLRLSIQRTKLPTGKSFQRRPPKVCNTLRGVKIHNVDRRKTSDESNDDDVQHIDVDDNESCAVHKQQENESQEDHVINKEVAIIFLVDWLNLQKDRKCPDGSVNVILLDPDPTSAVHSGPIKISTGSPITCKLCLTKLERVPDVKNHAKNCWLHNKDRHIYCISCKITFKNPIQLKEHENRKHCCGTEPEVEELDKVSATDNSDENELDLDVDPDLLPLGAWIQKRKRMYPDIILVDPDPTSDAYLNSVQSLQRTTHWPIWPASASLMCQLCRFKCRTENEMKCHLEMCWTYNKSNHCYCMPCGIHFSSVTNLEYHRRVSKKCKSKPRTSLCCSVCHQEFKSRQDLKRHQDSAQEFFYKMKLIHVQRNRKSYVSMFLSLTSAPSKIVPDNDGSSALVESRNSNLNTLTQAWNQNVQCDQVSSGSNSTGQLVAGINLPRYQYGTQWTKAKLKSKTDSQTLREKLKSRKCCTFCDSSFLFPYTLENHINMSHPDVQLGTGANAQKQQVSRETDGHLISKSNSPPQKRVKFVTTMVASSAELGKDR